MHLFVTGEIGAGKSTILKKILQKDGRIPYGFLTEKGPATPSGREIFLRPATGGEGKVIARCVSETSFETDVETLETFGVALLSNVPDGALVLMDELGFLESRAPSFCEQVLRMLDRNVTVLGAIKPLALPFLNAVRNHPKVRVITVTPKNRDAALRLAEQLLFQPANSKTGRTEP
ncbi:MAG: nucleoside-triphosphatase [Christensenellales bacterium]